MNVNKFRVSVLASLLMTFCSTQAQEYSTLNVYNLSIEELLQIKTTSVSGVEESIANAPASIVVITEQQIRQRGYHSIHEIFGDLPGFDSYVVNGARFLYAYQRGYRQPLMSRTLFMINGRIQNNLWSHVAYASRQLPMSNIERIEVLYGPVSVIYGPNAFLGVVNVITKDGSELQDGEDKIETRLAYGSWNTVNLDITASGHHDKFSYSLSGKVYTSDEPGLDDFGKNYGWVSDELYGSQEIWGPILELDYQGTPLNKYADPSNDWGFMAELTYGSTKLSYSNWEIDEAYGSANSADTTQAGVSWIKNATEYALSHSGNLSGGGKVKTLLSYRTTQEGGGFAEADAAADDPRFSLISFSDWDTQNSATLFEQDYEHQLNTNWQINGGIKLEKKTLTKAFDLCGYFLGANCSSAVDEPGPEGFGAGVFDSRSDTFVIQPGTSGTIPPDNIIKTEDAGIYVQGIYDKEDWRFSSGVRFDRNSEYGSSTNPRISGLYRFSIQSRIKLLYGEAFQEPPNIQLYGGWNGRRANPDLKPETLKHYEVIYQYQQEYWLHDVSLYLTQYDNVVKEEALNQGTREVRGLEYRGSYQLDNFIPGSKPITGYVYYTYTDNTSSTHYEYGHVDVVTGDTSNGWFDGETDVGDISPQKLNVSINIPIMGSWNVNIRGQYHGKTKLYSRNRLRNQGEDLDAYTLVNLTFGYLKKDMSVLLKVDNLLNERYFIPGVKGANAGNDFDAARSSGFKSSLISTPLRSYMLMVNFQF